MIGFLFIFGTGRVLRGPFVLFDEKWLLRKKNTLPTIAFPDCKIAIEGRNFEILELRTE